MHGTKRSRPRHAGLPAGDGPGTYRFRPGDAQDRPGDDPARPSGSWTRLRQRRQRRRQIRAARRTIAGRHPAATAVLAVLVLLTPVWVSLGNALADPGLGTSVAARGVEWFRGHGGSGIVNWAENLWYSHHPPPVGGQPAQSAIPRLDPATSGPVRAALAHLPAPRRMTSPVSGDTQDSPLSISAARLLILSVELARS